MSGTTTTSVSRTAQPYTHIMFPHAATLLPQHLRRIHHQRYRPVIDQRHPHVCAESAFFDGESLRPQRVIEGEPHAFGVFRCAGCDEARPVAFADVAVQRELRNGKDFAVMLRNRLVHAPAGILEHSQSGDFARQPVDFPLPVRIRDPDKQHIACADGLLLERRIDAVRCGVYHVDAGFAYAL